MTVLSSHTLLKLKPVEPFIDATRINGMTAGLSHCGYDIRCKQGLVLDAGEFRRASTVERFFMEGDIMGVVHDKSTWARRGLSVFNTVLEPGWHGFLTLELINHGRETLVINAGDPIAQVIFHRLDIPVAGYDGKYQNQPDRPVSAIMEGER